jgi:hypothetical protein
LLGESERDNRLLSSSRLELQSKEESKEADGTKKEMLSQVICNLKNAQWEKVLFYL